VLPLEQEMHIAVHVSLVTIKRKTAVLSHAKVVPKIIMLKILVHRHVLRVPRDGVRESVLINVRPIVVHPNQPMLVNLVPNGMMHKNDAKTALKATNAMVLHRNR
jgi:hypothetical protein